MTSAESAPPLILVADDDAHIRELVSLYLKRAGFSVETASDGAEAILKTTSLSPALLILDVMMPGQDGIQVCQALRRRTDIPIIMLTARSGDLDKVAGLRIGADDYVTKPFNPDELVARVEAILRRARPPGNRGQEHLSLGSLEIDPAARMAAIDGTRLSLTPKEFDLLATFARFPGTALDREHLLDLVWGTSFYSIRTVDVHVARVREKLRGSPIRIETVWGTGYRMSLDERPVAK